MVRETTDPVAFATWSSWSDRRALQAYRRSEWFGTFWPQVKTLLRAPAIAISYYELDEFTSPQSADHGESS